MNSSTVAALGSKVPAWRICKLMAATAHSLAHHVAHQVCSPYTMHVKLCCGCVQVLLASVLQLPDANSGKTATWMQWQSSVLTTSTPTTTGTKGNGPGSSRAGRVCAAEAALIGWCWSDRQAVAAAACMECKSACRAVGGEAVAAYKLGSSFIALHCNARSYHASSQGPLAPNSPMKKLCLKSLKSVRCLPLQCHHAICCERAPVIAFVRLRGQVTLAGRLCRLARASPPCGARARYHRTNNFCARSSKQFSRVALPTPATVSVLQLKLRGSNKDTSHLRQRRSNRPVLRRPSGTPLLRCLP